MSDTFRSRTVQVARRSASLRVTVPQVVAAALGLRPGDSLVWALDPDSRRVTVARGAPEGGTEPVPRFDLLEGPSELEGVPAPRKPDRPRG